MNSRRISILHLAPDEKFINSANWQFEKAFSDCNDFIIITSNKHISFKYVEQLPNVKRIGFKMEAIKNIAYMTKDYDCVILHGLSNFNCSVFLLAEDKTKFIAFFWGAEFYDRKDINLLPTLGELTTTISKKFSKRGFVSQLKQIIKQIIPYGIKPNKSAVIKTGKTISFLATSSDEELNYLKGSDLIGTECKFFPFSYYPLEFIIKGNNETVNNSNILIGNSASLTNNHLETMEILLKLNISNRRVIAPLNYGNIKYANYIQQEGEKRFREKFTALRNFLPITEYNEIVRGCGIVIMNHYRQQAFGNIIACLWMGSKLYLSEKNIIFSYLKRLGIIVFSIESGLNSQNESALVNLSQKDVFHNRKILKDTFGETKLIQDLKDSIKEIFLNKLHNF